MSTPSDALDPSLRELVELFAGPLATVSFPGVDGRRLGTLAAQVEADTAELARLDAAAAALRQRLSDARDDLLQRAQRALAYARVYADGEGPPELAAQLDAVVLPRTRSQRPAPAVATTAATAEPAAPRKRGRPRKEPQPTTLFAAAGPAATVAAAPVVS
ncbi:MAG: hypothetical protein JNK64_06450 [Myxococcales bacterium]|nr:hypothetical protein [Myxococcales bacterium]